MDTQVVAQEIVAKRDKFSGWIKIAALGVAAKPAGKK